MFLWGRLAYRFFDNNIFKISGAVLAVFVFMYFWSAFQRAIDSTGCKEFHMSGKVNIGSKMEYQFHKINGDLPIEIENLNVADFEEIKRARDILNRNDKKR